MKNNFPGYLTVGHLLDFIEKHNLPRDAKVFYQRIEDSYFTEKGGWKTVKKQGYFYHQAVKTNKRVDEGYYDDKEEFPLLVDPQRLKVDDDFLETLKEEYILSFAPAKYKDDDNLYIDAFY